MNRASGTSYRGTTFSQRMAGAPCLEEDPELGFPPGDGIRGKGKDAREAEAKAVCHTCPTAIRRECLELAMRTEGAKGASARHGVYGGLDPDQRAALARRRKGASA